MASTIDLPAGKAGETRKQIAEAEGFPIEKIDEFVTFIRGEPYITSSGLQFKMLQQYKPGKFAVEALIPSREEYTLLRRMMGLKEEDPLVVMRGEVWIEGFDRPFVDYGTATPNNLKGFITFSDYPLEMATRRATNRAMRLATATGMCSVDEMPACSADLPARQADATRRQAHRQASREQIELVRRLGQSHLLDEETRIEVEAFLDEAPDKRQASEMIDHLKATINAQRRGTQRVEAGVKTE